MNKNFKSSIFTLIEATLYLLRSEIILFFIVLGTKFPFVGLIERNISPNLGGSKVSPPYATTDSASAYILGTIAS